MLSICEEKLSSLKNKSILSISESSGYCDASVTLALTGGGKIRADYWRLIKDGKAFVSSFDHNQQYGLSFPINAARKLQEELKNKNITDIQLDKETGDILCSFYGGTKFQVLNFTGYEVWEINFADGTKEYSNYIYRK